MLWYTHLSIRRMWRTRQKQRYWTCCWIEKLCRYRWDDSDEASLKHSHKRSCIFVYTRPHYENSKFWSIIHLCHFKIKTFLKIEEFRFHTQPVENKQNINSLLPCPFNRLKFVFFEIRASRSLPGISFLSRSSHSFCIEIN